MRSNCHTMSGPWSSSDSLGLRKLQLHHQPAAPCARLNTARGAACLGRSLWPWKTTLSRCLSHRSCQTDWDSLCRLH